MSTPTTSLSSPQYDKSQLKEVGEDVFISANVEIRRPQLISIGSHTAIDSNVYITTGAEIGDYVHISPFTSIIGGATAMLYMDHFTGMAAGCRIICASDEHMGYGLTNPTVPLAYRDNVTVAPVRFEMFATVGSNVVIMPGVTLGEGCVVGANSLVTKSLESWTVYVGSPARPLKVRPRERMLTFAKEMGY